MPDRTLQGIELMRLPDAIVSGGGASPGTTSYGGIGMPLTPGLPATVRPGPSRGFALNFNQSGVPPVGGELPPAVPELPAVVISADAPQLTLWQRFNRWLQAPRKPATKRNARIAQFVLDYYANNYLPMPGAGGGMRVPRLSRSGPRSIIRQRGSVGVAAQPRISPIETAPMVLPPIRITPRPTPRVVPFSSRAPNMTPQRITLPFVAPEFYPNAVPGTKPRPQRRSLPAPQPQTPPAADPAILPVVTPSISPLPMELPEVVVVPRKNPAVKTAPNTRPKPLPGRAPTPWFDPLNPFNLGNRLGRNVPRPAAPDYLQAPRPVGLIEPVPNLGPVPLEDLDEQCDCDGKEKKKKPKKKKQPRQVCYSGTFRERSKSLTKVKRKVIPCQ